jgi:predicted nucleic acid-binding Zn ribbon protein
MAKVYWEAVVGPQVSGATQVLAVRGGDTLVVRAKSSVWMNELTLLKTDILSRLNRAIGGGRALNDIRFEIGALDPKTQAPVETPLPETADLEAFALPLDICERIARTAEGIVDDDLRVRVRRGLTRAAQADVWKRSHGWTPCARCGTLAQPAHDRLCPVCRIGHKPGSA